MKKYIPYIIAALIGFFICPVSCLAAGVHYYEFSWLEPFMAVFFATLTWCWRGENGIGADVERTLMQFKEVSKNPSIKEVVTPRESDSVNTKKCK